MNGYAELLAGEQRRIILDALEADPDYAHNDAILQSILDSFGYSISTDKLRTELAWLAEQGLITVDESGPVCVARLTRRGEDVALGRTVVPGVRRHRPGD